MLEVYKVCADTAFENLEQEWAELLDKSASKTIFLTWDWLFNWWRFYRGNKRLNLILVREGENLLAIAPICVSHKIGYQQIEFLGSEVGSDYLDFILYRGREEEILEIIFSYLYTEDNTWDVIKLAGIPSESNTIKFVKNSSWLQQLKLIVKHCTTCPCITLPQTWETFFNSLSRNMRSNLGRKRRRFERDLKGKFVIVSEQDYLAKAMYDFIRLNHYRMKMKNMESPFSKNSFEKFHKATMPIFFDKGSLKLCFLKIGDEPVAAHHVYRFDNKFLYYQSGFDPKWAGISPGLLLFGYCIENAISEGMQEFDFLQGNEQYKYKWTSEHRKNLDIRIYRDSLKGNIISWAETNRTKSKEFIKKVLKP